MNRGFYTLKQIPYTHSNWCVRVVVAEAGGSTRTQWDVQVRGSAAEMAKDAN